jgi:hypothetical protein
MTNNEFIKHITYNNIEINLGIDDYGQSYFIEYINPDTKEVVSEHIGSYITDYIGYIEYRFGKPEINCEHYNTVKPTSTKGCEYCNKMYCTKCDKWLSKKEQKALLKRQKDLEEWFKSHGKNIT